MYGSYTNFDNNRTHWRSLHSASNTINWSNLDTVVSGLQSAGISNGTYILYGCPTFLAQAGQAATAGPYGGLGEGSFPTDLTQLTYFCEEFALRNTSTWGGFFKRVQLFNEPESNSFNGVASNANFYWGTATQYVDMLSTAYTALKAADPTLIVMTPGTYNMTTFVTWLDAVGATTGHNGYNCFDAVALHPYHATPNPTYSGRGDFFGLSSGGIDRVHEILALRGRFNLDCYATEYGLDGNSTSGVVAAFLALSADERAKRVKRTFMGAARAGLKLLAPWSYGNANSYFGDLSGDTTGVIPALSEVYTAMAGKTIIRGGYYGDGRERLEFSDGSIYEI